MKIRTDFVTNSSSSSFGIIHIKSKALGEFLEKYRNADIPWTTDFIIDNDMINIEDMDDIFVPRNPTCVEEVLSALLDMLAGVNLEDVESPEFPEHYDYSEEQVKMLLEANKRVKELTDSIKTVDWHTGIAEWGMDEEEEAESGSDAIFRYDREKKISEYEMF